MNGSSSNELVSISASSYFLISNSSGLSTTCEAPSLTNLLFSAKSSWTCLNFFEGGSLSLSVDDEEEVWNDA